MIQIDYSDRIVNRCSVYTAGLGGSIVNRPLTLPPYLRLAVFFLFCSGATVLTAKSFEADYLNDGIASENVKAGHLDYPVQNVHATQHLELRGKLPSTLRIGFWVSYSADQGVGADLQSAKYCGYKVNSESFPAYSVVEPLNIVHEADRFHASVVIDKYLMGRCGWHFNGIKYKALDGAGDLTENWFAITYDVRRDGKNLRNLPRDGVAVWCRKVFDAVDPQKKAEKCANLATLQLISNIPSNVTASVPLKEQTNRGVTWIFSDTDTVEVNFYDTDASASTLGETP